jgi:hypothetical protein
LNKKETHPITRRTGYALTVNGLLRHYKPQIDIDVTTKIRKTMGKGSTPRKFSVTNEEYSNRWDAIFGRDNEKENKAQSLESDRPMYPCNSGSVNNSEGQTGPTQTS